MEKWTLQPLNNVEKQLIETWHDLVYAFLYKYGYSIENHYSIAIFGLIKGVQVWCRKPEINSKYQLQYVAWQYMRAECSNYTRTENAQKRKPVEPVVSLDAEQMENESIYNCVGGKSVEDEFVDMAAVELIMNELTGIQQSIVKMKMEGYENTEIILRLDYKPSTYYKELTRIKRRIRDLVA